MLTDMKTENKDFDFDFEYSPSRNAVIKFKDKNVDPIIVEEKFIKICKKETYLCSSKYTVRKDLCYGDIGQQFLDIYFKGNEKETPIFVFIHGGYWRSLDKSTSGVCAGPLVENGYRFIAVDYNLCPEFTLEEIVKQMQILLSWLLEYAEQTQACSISFCGHSAGAHLVSTMLLDPNFHKIPSTNLIKSIILISGIYDLREIVEKKVESANPGNILSLDEKKSVQLSPLCWNLSKEFIDYVNHVSHTEFHLIVAQYDSQTFQKQAQSFNEFLKFSGLNSTIHLFEGYDHFDIIEDLRFDNSDVFNYILRKLKLK